jgi:hypothetical protein
VLDSHYIDVLDDHFQPRKWPLLKGPFSLVVIMMTVFLLYDYPFLGVRASPVIAVTVFDDYCFPVMAIGITIMIAISRPDRNANTFFRMRGC